VPYQTVVLNGNIAGDLFDDLVVSKGVNGTGTLIINNSNNTYTGNTTVNAGATIIAAGNQCLGDPGDVTVNGTLILNPQAWHTPAPLPPTVNVVNTLTITGTGTVDIMKNKLIVKSGADIATYATITSQLGSGANFAAGGYWDGTGIKSSTANLDGTQTSAVGAVQNSVFGYDTFGGVAVDNNAILIGFTWWGDASLKDQVVDIDTDYALWSVGWGNYQNFGTPAYDPTLIGWEYGDFNGDGVIDIDTDYALWSVGWGAYQNFLGGGPGLPTAPGTVPEPASLVLLGLGAVSLLTKKRNRV
jgi:autotransporter-associated beta strand protein